MFHCAFVHAVLSLGLLRPAYYPGFFGDGTLTASAEGMLLFGALAAYLYWLVFRSGPAHRSFPALKVLAAACLCGHLLLMGSPKWIRPGDWPGHLPNMSLISFALAVTALALEVRAGRHRGGSSTEKE